MSSISGFRPESSPIPTPAPVPLATLSNHITKAVRELSSVPQGHKSPELSRRFIISLTAFEAVKSAVDEGHLILKRKYHQDAAFSRSEKVRKRKLYFAIACLLACVAYAYFTNQIGNPITIHTAINLPFLSISSFAVLSYCRPKSRPTDVRDRFQKFQSDPHYLYFKKVFSYNYNVTEKQLDMVANDLKFLRFYERIMDGLFYENITSFPEASKWENEIVKDYDLHLRTGHQASFVDVLAFPRGSPRSRETALKNHKLRAVDPKFAELIKTHTRETYLNRALLFLSVVAIVAAVASYYLYHQEGFSYIAASAGILVAARLIPKRAFKKAFVDIQKDPFYVALGTRVAAHFNMDKKTALKMTRSYLFFKLVNKFAQIFETKDITTKERLITEAKQLEKNLIAKYKLAPPIEVAPSPILSHLVSYKPIF